MSAPEGQRLELHVGDQVRLGFDRPVPLRWWTVRAVDSRYVVLTRQAEFQPKGTSQYTIIDWDRGIRGPCNLIGQGWDIDEPGGCESLLRALNLDHGIHNDETGEYLPAVEISHRNNVPVEIRETRTRGAS